MFKKLKKSLLVYILMLFTLITFILLTLLSKTFSSIYFILIGGTAGLIVYSIVHLLTNKKEKDDNDIS